MSFKGLSKTVIAAIIVAVLLISAVGVYFAFSGGDEAADPTGNTELDTTDNNTPTEPEEENENETPETETDPEEETPETETEPEETEEPETTTTDVSTATSMHYKVSITPAGEAPIEYEYMVKDGGTENAKMRVEIESEYEYSMCIINGETQTVWFYSEDNWLDLSDAYSTYWDIYHGSWESYQASLQDWTGGECRYDAPTGDSIVIYDIEVNPTLDDSLFEVIKT